MLKGHIVILLMGATRGLKGQGRGNALAKGACRAFCIATEGTLDKFNLGIRLNH